MPGRYGLTGDASIAGILAAGIYIVIAPAAAPTNHAVAYRSRLASAGLANLLAAGLPALTALTRLTLLLAGLTALTGLAIAAELAGLALSWLTLSWLTLTILTLSRLRVRLTSAEVAELVA